MKNLFYTFGAILFAILLFSFLFKGCDEQQKEQKIKERHQINLLANAVIFSVNDRYLPLFVQKITGQSRYDIALTVYDSLNVEEVKKFIDIDQACFDTLKVGQTVDYLKLSQQAKLSVKNSIGDGFILQLIVILVTLGVVVYGIGKIYEKFSFGR